MISKNDAKVSIECFTLCFEEAKKIKGVEPYQQYHLALEMSKTLIESNQKFKLMDYLLQSNFFLTN